MNFEDWEELLDSKELVVVDFWHDRCEWCRRLESELDEVAKDFQGKAKFVKLDILSKPRNTLLAHRYGVMSTPTLILFWGRRPVQEIIGYRPKDVLKNVLGTIIQRSDEYMKQSTPFEAN